MANKEKRSDQDNLSTIEKIRLYIEITTLVIGICFLILAYTQWDLTRAATKAAQDAVKIAQQAMELDQRPWVAVTDIRLEGPITEGKQTKVIYTYGNSGNSPALNVTIVANSGDAKPWPLPDRFPVFPSGGVLSRSVIPVGTNGMRGGVIPVRNTAQFNSLIKKETVFNVMGTIYYDDVLKKHHITHFCYFLPDPSTTNLVLCPNNNFMEDADEGQSQLKLDQ